MAVVRWDSWRELAALERQMNELVGWVRRSGASGPADRLWTPLIEAYEEGEHLVIRAELAGVEPEDVELTVEGDLLCIRGERREQRSSTEEGGWIRREFSSGRFERTMQLEPGTDIGAISAQVRDGILEVLVPNPSRSEGRRIAIEREDERATEIELGGEQGSGRGTNGSRTGESDGRNSGSKDSDSRGSDGGDRRGAGGGTVSGQGEARTTTRSANRAPKAAAKSAAKSASAKSASTKSPSAKSGPAKSASAKSTSAKSSTNKGGRTSKAASRSSGGAG